MVLEHVSNVKQTQSPGCSVALLQHFEHRVRLFLKVAVVETPMVEVAANLFRLLPHLSLLQAYHVFWFTNQMRRVSHKGRILHVVMNAGQGLFVRFRQQR